MRIGWQQCVLAGVVGVTFSRSGHTAEAAHGNAPEPAVADAPPSGALVYLRPALGWGGAIFGAPDRQPSFYRSAFGLGAGASWQQWSLGLDFTYFWGSKFKGVDSLQNPTQTWDAQMNAFRLAADASYDLEFRWLGLRPHALAGLEWRRATIAPDEVGVRRVPFLSPAVAALVKLRKDGRAALGIDGRFSVLFAEHSVDTQLSGFLVFEAKL